MNFISSITSVVIAIAAFMVVGIFATHFLRKRNRDLLIVVYSVILVGVILVTVQLLALSLTASSTRATTVDTINPPQTVKLNIPIACGDCEQNGISIILKSIKIDRRQQTMLFSFQVTNGTAHDWGLTFSSLKLTDPSGTDYDGQGDPFFVNAEQSAIENATFSLLPQHGVVYILKVVILRPNAFQNYYQTIPLTF